MDSTVLRGVVEKVITEQKREKGLCQYLGEEYPHAEQTVRQRLKQECVWPVGPVKRPV